MNNYAINILKSLAIYFGMEIPGIITRQNVEKEVKLRTREFIEYDQNN
jgi:hypothetical protein